MTKEVLISKEACKSESKIEASALAEEIAVAVTDLFEGEFKQTGADLVFRFLNGQIFKVSVEEIK